MSASVSCSLAIDSAVRACILSLLASAVSEHFALAKNIKFWLWLDPLKQVRKLYDKRTRVEANIQSAMQSGSETITNSKGGSQFEQKLFFEYFALMLDTLIDNKVEQARKEYASKYADVLRTTKDVFSVLDEILVDRHQLGSVWIPLSKKHQYML